jgi:hypothetical protein
LVVTYVLLFIQFNLSSQISNGQIISYRYKRDKYPSMNHVEIFTNGEYLGVG